MSTRLNIMHSEQLQAFVAVYEERSFTRASRKLIKSQSAVTQLVRSLESELDTMLFLRHTRPVTPTTDADRFYPFAQRILQTEREAISDIRASRQGKNVFTLCYRSIANDPLDRYLSQQHVQPMPYLTAISWQDFTSSENWQANILYWVRENAVRSKQIHFIPAWESQTYAVVSAKSRLGTKSVMTLNDLSGQKVLLPEKDISTPFAAALYRMFEADPSIIIRPQMKTDSLRYLLETEHYVCFRTAEFIRRDDGFRYIPFVDGEIMVYGFACVSELTSAMMNFIRGFMIWMEKS